MIKKVLLLAGILAVFSTTKAHPATDNDTIEVVYADTTGIDIDSIEASIDHIELDEVTVEASAWVRKADRNLLFPNAQQIKQSKNGLQLLQKLQIPGIVINPAYQRTSGHRKRNTRHFSRANHTGRIHR